MALVTDAAEMERAVLELTGGGPTGYVVLRVNEGSGDENRGRSLRMLIDEQHYLCRPPNIAEREALERGFEELGMADDLHALLKAAGIAPPYVIAGHSMGGVVARRFQSRYPEEVAGMLLIDSSHEDQSRRLDGHDRWYDISRAAKRRLRVLGVRRAAARFGLVRSLDAESLAWETVPEYAGAVKASSLSTKQRRTVVQEMRLFACPQGQPPDLGARPLAVLSVGAPSAGNGLTGQRGADCRMNWPRCRQAACTCTP